MITLRIPDGEIGVAPEHGATLLFYRTAGREILRPGNEEDVARDPRNAAMFVCVPYFGRLPSVQHNQHEHALAPTLPICDPNDALHGEGWVSPWEVTAQSTDAVTLRYAHRPAPGQYPFAYEATLTYRLTAAALIAEVDLTNHSDNEMPAGIGFHPFFHRMPDTAIDIAAPYFYPPGTALSDLDKNPFPDRIGQAGGPVKLPDQLRDHSYAMSNTSAHIDQPTMTITMTSDAPHWHLYAPDNEDHFCLESISHLPMAGTGLAPLGMAKLASGASLHHRLTITPDATPPTPKS